jgi:hypothetical protein
MRPEATIASLPEGGVHMKKTVLSLIAIPLALLMTGCFTLQGFLILKPALAPGKGTKARFIVHPHLGQSNPPYSNAYQFVLLGVSPGESSGTDALTIKKATWGTNGTFGGPKSMPVSSGFAATLDAAGDCSSLGYDFSSGSGLAWKGFLTAGKVKDKQKVGTSVYIDIGLAAKSSATSGDVVEVLAVTGAWIDSNTSGTVDSADEFDCAGNTTSFINIV